MSKLIFERSVPGSCAFSLPEGDVPPVELKDSLQGFLRESEPILPEVSEVEVVRHFTELSQKAFGVDSGMYPLGSCTMKYNPKINEWAARLPGFADLHPDQPEETVQGALELMYELEQMLCEITGMERFTLQPASGAHGEMTGASLIKAYHEQRQDFQRKKMVVPDSAHGTNPATAHMLGFEVIEVKSNDRGLVDVDDLRSLMSDQIAGLMLTNPNTLGLFEEEIAEISAVVHEAGGLLYYDGANLNAVMGVARPGDMGFDIVHLNLHKTFSTPHGGGGPGSGPVGVKDFLAEFLPVPLVGRKDGQYFLDYDLPHTIGKVQSFYGNFGVMVKAYAYIKALGGRGIKEACQHAVLNANYIRHNLREFYEIPYDRLCKHEFVASAVKQKKENGVTALDVAKRLIDYGYHPPTIYFPLIVEEAMMIEPTETETKGRLDDFIKAMQEIARESKENPELVKEAPTKTPIRRVDEVTAARQPILKWG
jgi:glycine dehydrogenase subunit 2